MTEHPAEHIKQLIYSKTVELMKRRITTAQAAVDAAIESKNKETKSSSGDKFETGRAMLQIEQEKNEMQVSKAHETLKLLETISLEERLTHVGLGSLVTTDGGIYFISVGIGKVVIESQTCFVISSSSPIGMLMVGKEKGEMITFRGKQIKITNIH